MKPILLTDRAVLFQGEAGDIAGLLPPNSVDAMCTDPPAGIAFMGRDWDGDKGGRDAWIKWLASIMREALRVLKPGAFALVWALPRTSHWTATALEDAGFEVRDVVCHLFGCLTADVEVLTPHGWVLGTSVREGDEVAQWDATTGAISIAPVQETFRALWSGDLVRFKNADTDQALTPNHRVYHRSMLWKRWSEYRVKDADDIGRASPIRLPLAGEHDGPGIGGEDYAALLGWVWTEGGYDAAPGTGVRIYQSSVNAPNVAEIDALLDRLGAHRRYERSHVSRKTGPYKYQAVTWYFSGDDLAGRVRADLPGKHPTYALLLRMTLAEKRAFLRAALLGDGSQGKNGSWTFEQKDPVDRAWFVTLLALVGWRGHDYARKARDGGSVSVTQHGDTTISAARMKDATEHYEGDVWCVRVPTGAFVARRRGQIFVTGNSGFPKSLNISKAIDAHLGAERPVVGKVDQACGVFAHSGGGIPQDIEKYAARDITAAGSPEATQWSGWGTALKPAAEHWILARKPLEGTYAENVLAHGTGGINIDATRIDTEENLNGGAYAKNGTARDDGWAMQRGGAGVYQQPTGRWPANVVLSHEPECADECAPGCAVAMLDEQSGTRKSGTRKSGTRKSDMGYHGAAGDGGPEVIGSEGGASRFFYCAKGSRSEKDAGLDHLPKRTGNDVTGRTEGSAGSKHGRAGMTASALRNHHPTVKSIALMRWLVRLITPPGGVVLDVFAGSGTTGVAALAEGFEFVGVERDLDDDGKSLGYIEIAKGRLEHALKTPASIKTTDAATCRKA